jgi:hypothetical protein
MNMQKSEFATKKDFETWGKPLSEIVKEGLALCQCDECMKHFFVPVKKAKRFFDYSERELCQKCKKVEA